MTSASDVSAIALSLLETIPYTLLICYSIYVSQRGFCDETSLKKLPTKDTRDFSKPEIHDKIECDTFEVRYGPKKGHLQLIYGGKGDESAKGSASQEKIAG